MKALLIGATGLIGNYLLQKLLANNSFTDVTVIHRSASKISHPKLSWHVVDFAKSGEWSGLVKGDVLFNAMGTTKKKAGSEKAMISVDVSIPAEVASIAKKNEIHTVVSVSAAGANAKSGIFYNKIKGQLEDHLFGLEFAKSCMLRPSLLVGDRDESRLGEKLMTPIMNFFSFIPFLRKYRPVHGKLVAQAMIKYAMDSKKAKLILELDEIQDYTS
jgi:uncharacterized protein YbjT (DUF2867 family)